MALIYVISTNPFEIDCKSYEKRLNKKLEEYFQSLLL